MDLSTEWHNIPKHLRNYRCSNCGESFPKCDLIQGDDTMGYRVCEECYSIYYDR